MGITMELAGRSVPTAREKVAGIRKGGGGSGREEMIAVVDRNYRYVIANHAFLSHRGMKKEELVGRRISEVLNSGVFESTVKEKLDECLRGKNCAVRDAIQIPGVGISPTLRSKVREALTGEEKEMVPERPPLCRCVDFDLC
jgi:hypothetical protein